MKKEIVQGQPKRQKPRLGVHPTMVERDKTKYSRKRKHKNVLV